MRLHHLLFVLLINVIWGLNFIAIKYAVSDLSPVLTNAVRFLIVGIALSPFLKIIKGRMKPILWVATVLGILHFGIVIISIALSDGVSELAIASQLSVPLSTILAVMMLGEVIRLPRILGITLSFLGVIVMGFDPKIFAHIDALLLMVLGAFFVSYATILMRKLKDVPAMTIQAWVALAGFSGSVFLSLLLETGQMEALQNISSTAMWAVLFSAIGSSVIGHSGLNYLLRQYEVSVIMPYMLLMPVFGVMASVFILDETLTSRMITGGIITLVGVSIITFRNQKRMAKPEHSD